MFKDDGDIALKMIFPLLKKFEKENDIYGQMRCYHIIGMSYSTSKSYDLSFKYLNKAIEVAIKNNYIKFLSVLYNDIGVVYFEAGNPNEGIIYAQKALQLDTKSNDLARLPISLSTVGENYIAAKSYDLALPFLRRAFLYDKKQKLNSYTEVYLNNDMAEVFLGLNQLDSAVFYANKGAQKAMISNFKNEKLRSYNFLLEIYKRKNNHDSLNKYYPLIIKTKDELFNFKKLRSVENSNFAEQIRQRDIETEKIKIENERGQLFGTNLCNAAKRSSITGYLNNCYDCLDRARHTDRIRSRGVSGVIFSPNSSIIWIYCHRKSTIDYRPYSGLGLRHIYQSCL